MAVLQSRVKISKFEITLFTTGTAQMIFELAEVKLFRK